MFAVITDMMKTRTVFKLFFKKTTIEAEIVQNLRTRLGQNLLITDMMKTRTVFKLFFKKTTIEAEIVQNLRTRLGQNLLL